MGMDPKYLKEYSSEKHFVLYEAAPYSGLCGEMVVFRAMGGTFAGPSIDLIFLGLVYFEMPNRLQGVRVWRPRDEGAIQFGKSYAPYYGEQLGEGFTLWNPMASGFMRLPVTSGYTFIESLIAFPR